MLPSNTAVPNNSNQATRWRPVKDRPAFTRGSFVVMLAGMTNSLARGLLRTLVKTASGQFAIRCEGCRSISNSERRLDRQVVIAG